MDKLELLIKKVSAFRDEGDGRHEVGIHSVHIAPFSPVSRFAWHGLWPLADFFSILMEPVTGVDDASLTRGLKDRHRS